jgi:pseudouridine synthase
MQIRLQKILSAAGVASRRAAERLIQEGRVSVNGRVVRELGTRADPDRDEIRFDDRRLKPARQRLYLLLNKPRGYVTTRSDPQGRPTVLHLLRGVRGYLYPVGRLDYDSEGLLILTNDGELAARLTHPRHEVEKVYEARVRGVPEERDLERLRMGILIDGRKTAPATVTLMTRRGSAARDRAGTVTLRIGIHEGRTHQVRRMCDAIGHPVVDLRRIRIGPISDPSLKVGAYRELSEREVLQLKGG